jgi:hypothetical protein
LVLVGFATCAHPAAASANPWPNVPLKAILQHRLPTGGALPRDDQTIFWECACQGPAQELVWRELGGDQWGEASVSPRDGWKEIERGGKKERERDNYVYIYIYRERWDNEKRIRKECN